MNKRKVWLWIAGMVVLLIAGAFVGGMGMLGLLPWQCGDLYEDPQGRFPIEIDPNWEQVETDGSYAQFKVPDPPINMYLLVLEAGTVDDAFSQAMEVVGFDPGLLNGDSVTTFGDWYAYQQTDAAGLTYALAGQIAGDKAYVMMVKTDKPGVSVENVAILQALYSKLFSAGWCHKSISCKYFRRLEFTRKRLIRELHYFSIPFQSPLLQKNRQNLTPPRLHVKLTDCHAQVIFDSRPVFSGVNRLHHIAANR